MTSDSINWLTARPIAHRGLHDGNEEVFENTLPAFDAAIRHNYAIECDVRLSADGAPFVFHDENLIRLTGQSGLFRSMTAEEISRVRLGPHSAAIPTLQDLFDLVAGRVPLVVEMKGSSPAEDAAFLRRIQPALDAYEGPLAIMSFDEWLIDQALAGRRSYPVGLTAEGTHPDRLVRHRTIVERGCDFVSYNVYHLANTFTAWVQNERRLPLISWTVRTPPEAERSALHADQMTFEGFLPQI